MRILFIGDIMGRSGREALIARLPELKAKLKPDVVIVNGENAVHGVGITDKVCKEFYEAGTDVITTGNHVWGQKELLFTIDRDPKTLRPINYPKETPGKGFYIHTLHDGRKIMVINALGRVFMEPLEDPFQMIADLVEKHPLARGVTAIFVDMHAEASSEKMALAQYLDGRVSAVVGTHTHMPTADCQIFDGGTAYQTDAGMTGDYNSVIGMEKTVPIHRFTRKTPTDRMQPADGEATVCGTFIVTDDKTGLATAIEPVRVGPRLSQAMPQI